MLTLTVIVADFVWKFICSLLFALFYTDTKAPAAAATFTSGKISCSEGDAEEGDIVDGSALKGESNTTAGVTHQTFYRLLETRINAVGVLAEGTLPSNRQGECDP
uniref:Secreted protein n=1 Tax=Panagrellus redivivus TaxID=6233 RepID=A0A7E4ZSN6_PANRE